MLKGFDELECKGFNFNLLNYLWMKNPYTSDSMQMYLPSTILIRNGEPKLWYQSIGGHIRKKRNLHLDSQNILSELSKGKIDIKAMFVEMNGENGSLKFSYLTQKCLRLFFQGVKENYSINGILQKFVHPKGLINQVIKVHWSQNFFIAQSYQNPNPIADSKFDIYQRALTFQSIQFSSSKPVRSKMLLQKLQTFCQQIYLHVLNSTNHQIQILDFECYLKLCYQQGEERIYFLFCSQLHLSDHLQLTDSNVHIKKVSRSREPTIFQIPAHINKKKLFRRDKVDLSMDKRCENCMMMCDKEEVFLIEYKKIIKAWKNTIFKKVKHHESSAPKLIEVIQNIKLPFFFRNKYPKLTLHQFNQQLKDMTFLNKKAEICESCFLQIMSKVFCFQNIKSMAAHYQLQAEMQQQPKIIIRKMKKESSSPLFSSEKRVRPRIAPMTPEQVFENQYRGLKRRYKNELNKVNRFLEDLSQNHLEEEMTANPIMNFDI